MSRVPVLKACLGMWLVGAASEMVVAQPEGFSGLVGRTLTVERADVGGLLGDLILSRHKGRFVSATVREDKERVLSVDVAYDQADLTQPKVMTGLVQGANGLRQPVVVEEVPLTAAAGTVRLRFALRSGLEEGTNFESTKLVVRIKSESGAKYDAAATFSLPKRWSLAVRPENVIVEVSPVAVGSIPATDPLATGTAPPPKILKPETMLILSKPLLLTPLHIVTPAPTPKPAPKPVLDGRIYAVSPVLVANLRKLPPVTESAGLPPAVVDKGGRGPGGQAFRIFDTLRSAPGIGLTADKLTSINADLYRDANPDSGIFYYLPARYTLFWDADNGYALRFLYGAASQPDAAGSVSVTARLTSGIDSFELDLLKSLLKAALPQAFKELKPFPFSGTPGFSFKDDLRRFDIPAEKVSISAISDLAGEVDLAFVADTATKDMIELTLTQGLGLTGTATFTSASAGDGASFSRTIPVQLRVADPASFGTVYWKRGETFRNQTPFPLLLKHIHFLTLASDGTPTVYTYRLGNTELAPQAQARIADTSIQGWLDGRALRAWMEYGVREDYPAGIEKAKADWSGGLGQLSTTNLKLTTLTPFSDPGGIARILVDVKSKYFEPTSRTEAVRQAALTRDNETVTVGPIFLVNRSLDEIDKEGDPLFSFRLSLVTPDGDVAGPGAWTDGDRLEIFLGSRQVRQVLPRTPTPAPTEAP